MKRFWIINLILFQAAWLCSAFFTEYAHLLLPLIIAIHFALSPTKLLDCKVLMLLPLGIALDSLMLHFGVFETGRVLPLQTWFPIWLLGLWILFILSLNHSLHWLSRCSKVILFVIGAVGGTSSYWGGMKAGALVAAWPSEWVLVSLALGWGLLLPTLVAGYAYLTQQPTTQPE